MVKDVKSHANARKLHDEVDEEFTDIKTAKEVAGFVAPQYDFRQKKFPIKTGMAAICLFTVGSMLIYVSTRIGLDGEHRGLSFLILGLIAFIPGSYATTQLYGAYKGWKGYDYTQIPSYDD